MAAEGLKIEGEKGSGRQALRSADTLRPDTRADSVREAEEYARQITEALGHDNYNPDEFHIDRQEIPDGWSYQWKASAIAGKENVYHILGLRRAGWREVPAERHPYKMPKGYVGAITIKGLTLMEIPKILTDKAEYAHIRESKEALRTSEAKLYEAPANTAPRDDPSVTRAGLNKVTKDFANPRSGLFED
jgi:hypothetical protein